MQVRPESIQSVTVENWTKREYSTDSTTVIQPVRKADKSSAPKLDQQKTSNQTPDRGGQVDQETAQELVGEVQSYLENLNIELNFKVDDQSGEFVVQVLNPESGEIIRQIPPEDLLELRGKLKELRGILFDKKV